MDQHILCTRVWWLSVEDEFEKIIRVEPEELMWLIKFLIVSNPSDFTTWGLRPPAMRAQSELTPFPSYQIMLRNNEVILPQLPGGHFSLSPITGAQLAY